MATHRYWRAVGLEAYGAEDLELSCFHLLDETALRVDASATLTANTAPSVGTLANLQDDDLTTAARWATQSVARLVLSWDFGGSPRAVEGVALAGNSQARFTLFATLQYSDDGAAWTTHTVFDGVAWPGVATKTLSRIPDAGSAVSWNPLDKSAGITLSNGNQTATGNASAAIRATGSKAEGKYQFEVTTSATNSGSYYIGVGRIDASLSSGPGTSTDAKSWGLRWEGPKWFNSFDTPYTSPFSVGDVIGVVVDFTAQTISFYRNGVSLGIAFSGVTGALYPMVGGGGSGSGWVANLNTGARTYPVNGASPWGALGDSKALIFPANLVRGRVAVTSPINVGTGPTVIYGIPQLLEPVRLSIESGAVKDYATGVLGKGIGRVRGDTKVHGSPDAPVSCKVRLIRERDGLLIREVWSDPVTGEYDFMYIDELQIYTILSYYRDGAFRAVVADGQIPELIA